METKQKCSRIALLIILMTMFNKENDFTYSELKRTENPLMYQRLNNAIFTFKFSCHIIDITKHTTNGALWTQKLKDTPAIT